MAEVLGAISSIIAILELSGTIIDYVHKIKSASADCDRILLEISSVNGFLSSLKELIMRAESQSIWLETVKSLDSPTGPISQYETSLKRLELKLKPVIGWKKAGKAVRWPFEKAEILEILGNIERQKTFFILALENDHVRLSLAIEANVADIKNHLSYIRSGINELGTGSQEQQMAVIYAWLDPLSGDFEKKQAHLFNLKGRQDGVCKWLLETYEFKNWISGAYSTLWCSGAPGIGKTVISSFVIDYLFRKFETSNDVAIVFLYCDYKDSDKQTTRNMMASILRQILLQLPQISSDLKAMYDKHKHRGSEPSLSEILMHLRLESTVFKTVFVVVDALDENAHDSLDELLTSIQAISPRAHCFFTSRPNIHLNVNDIVHLKIEANAADIEGYLNSRIEQSVSLAKLVHKEPTLKDHVVSTIIEKANGMFLLARLHVQSLHTKTNLRKLKSALNTLPEERDQAYDELIERIQNQDADYVELAMKALLWIVNAKRPLKMEELVCALAIEPGDTSLDSDGFPESDLLITVCAGMVTFEPESRVVGLVHSTAQEYLMRKGPRLFPDAQMEMCLICLTALSFETAPKTYYGVSDEHDIVHQLSQYAVSYWADHMHQSPDNRSSEELALDFVCSQEGLAMETVRLRGVGVLTLLELRHTSYAASGLCVLAALGLNHALKLLLDEDLRLHASNSSALDCALLFAVFHGQRNTVALLVEQGANVNYRSTDTETALHYAALKNDEHIAKLLISYQADIDATADVRPYFTQHLHPGQQTHRWTALHLAASLEHTRVVQFLLQHGAQVTQRDLEGHTALHLAVAADAVDVVNLLLDACAKVFPWLHSHMASLDERPSQHGHNDQSPGRAHFVDVGNGLKQTALHLAAFFDSEKVVPLLIRAGAEVNARDDFNNTALLVATNGREAKISIIAALLEAGADVDAAGTINGDRKTTALHLAIEPNKYEILLLLLQNKAISNAKNGTGSTSLHLATWLGSGMRTYKALLEAGADVNAQDLKGNTVLHLAIVAGEASIIIFFVYHGAKAETMNNRGETALDLALKWKRLYPCGVGPEDPLSVISILRNVDNEAEASPNISIPPLVLRPK